MTEPYVLPVIHEVAYPQPAFPMAQRSPSSITDLIFHHSDGPGNQSPLAIDAEHRAEGWCMIGYNFVISSDGTVYAGRNPIYVPSAAYGRNAQSVNVCLLGDFEPGTNGYGQPTSAQVQAAKMMAVYLHARYPSIVRTIGHRDVAVLFYPDDRADYATACPGLAFEALLPEIRSYVTANRPH